jgi:hypothetical protein
MPDDLESTITEVVTYKVAAKIFPDKEEPKVVKTWETESQVWVAWNRTYNLKNYIIFLQVLTNFV